MGCDSILKGFFKAKNTAKKTHKMRFWLKNIIIISLQALNRRFFVQKEACFIEFF